jgi:hypothetical protein
MPISSLPATALPQKADSQGQGCRGELETAKSPTETVTKGVANKQTEVLTMTTIGTFFKDGYGYRGLISTAILQGRARITPDPYQGPGEFVLYIDEQACGYATTDADGLIVMICSSLSPAFGQARLVERDGYFVLSA